METPTRSTQQRLDALDKANYIRTQRAQLKRDVKARRVQIRGVVETPPDWVETMKLVELLLAAPKTGRVKANRIINACRISHTKTIGGLSERQRAEVLAYL